MSNKPSFELNNEEIATIKLSLELFIANSIEGVTPERKFTQNALAVSTGLKLSNKETDFNSEDLRIMAVALNFFQIFINDTPSASIDKDSGKYLRIISNVLDMIEKNLNYMGHSLYSL